MMIHVKCITPIVKFKTTMRSSSLCDYSDVFILAKGTITVIGVGAPKKQMKKKTGRNNKQAIFKNFAPFTNCITEIINT